MKRMLQLFAVSMLAAVLITDVTPGFSETLQADVTKEIPIEVAYDITRWDLYWKPGEKVMEKTEEAQSRIESVLQKIDQDSAGTPVREGADNDTIELQYAEYQRMLQEGAEIRERLFDDIGTYIWALGIPDDQSITQDEAKDISCRMLLEEAGISEEQMSHFYPHCSYETGDPENPFWLITWMPFDHDS